MNEPLWRVCVSFGMYEGMDNFSSLCERAGRSFSDGTSSASDVHGHTAGQGLTHPPSVVIEAPGYMLKADSRATGRVNSSDVVSSSGDSTDVLQGSIKHRASQTMEEVEEETHPLTDLQHRSDAVSRLDRVTYELRENLEHERERRLDLISNVNRLSSALQKDRAEFALSASE